MNVDEHTIQRKEAGAWRYTDGANVLRVHGGTFEVQEAVGLAFL